MKVVVLIKQVPDTWGERRLDPTTGLVDRQASDRIIDEISERAVEVALSHKDRERDTEVVVLTMGPAPATETLRKALSMGADAAVHVLDDSLAGADHLRTATVLAAAIRKTGFDVVVTGNESTDGRGGVIPAMLAELLGVPAALNLESVELRADEVAGIRSTEDATMAVRAPLPTVVSITERTPEPRFPNLKGIMGAKKKPMTVLSVADLDVDAPASSSVILSVNERPARAGGEVIVDDGSAAAKLADYLAANRLI
jgi:electron transfer flavoprotein beta subunit